MERWWHSADPRAPSPTPPSLPAAQQARLQPAGLQPDAALWLAQQAAASATLAQVIARVSSKQALQGGGGLCRGGARTLGCMQARPG